MRCDKRPMMLGVLLFWPPEGVSFGIQYKVVEANQIRRRENQIEVLQCLRHPEALENTC